MRRRVSHSWWSHPGRQPTALAGVVAVATAYGWWATSLPPFAIITTVAVLAPALALLAIAPSPRRERATAPTRARRGAVVWAVLLAGLAAWQMLNFKLHPRSEHPTISSMLNSVDSHPFRLLLFVAWLALGWDISRR